MFIPRVLVDVIAFCFAIRRGQSSHINLFYWWISERVSKCYGFLYSAGAVYCVLLIITQLVVSCFIRCFNMLIFLETWKATKWRIVLLL